VAGVHAVLTGEDIGHVTLGRALFDWPVLAWDRVRFIGDRVVAIAAESHEAAEEAASMVSIEYEELSAVFDVRKSLEADAPILHPDRGVYPFTAGQLQLLPHANMQGYASSTKGDPDIDRALTRADRVFEHVFTTPRQHQGYIEPHAVQAWFQGETFHVISTSKSPFSLRSQLSTVTGLPVELIEVDNAFIGGDFGGKGLNIDEFVCFFLARATGRPIKSVMSYADELQAANPRHPSLVRLRTGIMNDGRILAHHGQLIFDGGAYAAGKPQPALTLSGSFSTLCAYNVPNVKMEQTVVYTNQVPCGHMRAPGELQAIFAGESHVDAIAREIGMDPLEFRRVNALRPGDTSLINEVFREVRALEIIDRLDVETRERRASLPVGHGIGFSVGYRHISGGRTGLEFSLLPDGRIQVLTGVPDQGSGSFTVIQRVAAAALSVDPKRVVVTHGTTANAPMDQGAGASRVTHVVGQAARTGAVQMKERLEALAAESMGWAAGAVTLERDLFFAQDGSSESASYDDVIARIVAGPPVVVDSHYASEHAHGDPGDFNFFGYAVETCVDPETGHFIIVDVTLVVDVGTIINPVAHQGQLDGGFVYGLGNTVLEEMPMDDGKVVTVNLGEYKLPTIHDVPKFRTVLLPTTLGPGPFGAKMAGEASNTGIAPATANSIADACGVRLMDLPLKAELIHTALLDAGDRSPAAAIVRRHRDERVEFLAN
jgi:CO/xanthine dehydrogenase Mo-binding subunit